MERDAKKQHLTRMRDDIWEEIPQVIFSITFVVPRCQDHQPINAWKTLQPFYEIRIRNVLTRNNSNTETIYSIVWQNMMFVFLKNVKITNFV